MDFEVCPDCQGEGEFVVCCDDICVGQGRCIHGEDGMEICSRCNGAGEFCYETEEDYE